MDAKKYTKKTKDSLSSWFRIPTSEIRPLVGNEEEKDKTNSNQII